MGGSIFFLWRSSFFWFQETLLWFCGSPSGFRSLEPKKWEEKDRNEAEREVKTVANRLRSVLHTEEGREAARREASRRRETNASGDTSRRTADIHIAV